MPNAKNLLMQLRKNGIDNIMKPKSLTLEEYIIFNNIFEGIESDNTILEGKLDFLSNIDNDMLTINCKYCDIKINVKTSKLELFFGNPDKPSLELLGKDFLNLVDLKNDVKDIESLATSGEKPQNMNFTQNVDFLKKLFSKYKNEIQTAIKDVSNVNKQDEVKFEWKLSFDECQVWPPKSEGFNDNVKFYLDFSLSVGCILELSKDDFKDAQSVIKAILNAYIKNGASVGFSDSEHPVNLKLKEFVFDGIKFTELVKKFKEVFANANISSLVEILKMIPEFAFGMPLDNAKNDNDSKEFVNQFKQIIKKSMPKLKELKKYNK